MERHEVWYGIVYPLLWMWLPTSTIHHPPSTTSGAAASAARSAKLGNTEGKVLSARDRSSAETSSCAGMKGRFFHGKITCFYQWAWTEEDHELNLLSTVANFYTVISCILPNDEQRVKSEKNIKNADWHTFGSKTLMCQFVWSSQNTIVKPSRMTPNNKGHNSARSIKSNWVHDIFAEYMRIEQT